MEQFRREGRLLDEEDDQLEFVEQKLVESEPTTTTNIEKESNSGGGGGGDGGQVFSQG